MLGGKSIMGWFHWLVGLAALFGITTAVSQAYVPKNAVPTVQQFGGRMHASCLRAFERMPNGKKYCTCLSDSFSEETREYAGKLFSEGRLGSKEFERRIQRRCVKYLRRSRR